MNQVRNAERIMRGVGELFLNSMKFANNVNRSYSDEFAKEGGKVGYTVNARLPQRYRVNKGQALVISPVNDNIVPITITDQAHIGLEFSMASLTLEIEDYKKRYIAPAVEALVNQLDFDGLQRMYQEVWNTVGTPGVVPGSTGTLPQAAMAPYLAANTKLTSFGIGVAGRIAILSPAMHASLMSGVSQLFSPASQIASNFKTGMFGGAALGIEEWYMDQNLAVHTVGALGGAPQVNGAGQTGTTLLVKNATANVVGFWKKGDVIQLTGVYGVNSMNYQSIGILQDFVVQADVDTTAGGLATVSIKPALSTSGTSQTVNAGAADSAPITTFGHVSAYANLPSPQGLIYNPDAFACVMVDLEMPGGVWAAERIRNKALGIAVRFVKAYSVMTDQSPARLDIMYGWKAVRPEMAVRVAS
ncbi:MAG: hypothetical protein H0W42_03040 [Gemmatimonadaceae bacterium]|nr:hypothetical protein [Gemmatimonadaceae bacterium]